MAEPEWDRSTGRWYIRYRLPDGMRGKKTLPKHDGWTKTEAKPKRVPTQVLYWARPFQDIDTAARLGHNVRAPRSTELVPFLESYRKSFAISRRPNSQKALKHAVKRLVEYCAAKRITTMEAVTVPVARQYLEGMRLRGLSFNTTRLDRGLLGTAWKRANIDELIVGNPWTVLETPGEDDGEGTPSWTKSEVEKILGSLKGWARDVFIVGINSGFRCQAIRHMTWGWVHWTVRNRKRGVVVCPKEFSKNGKQYSVPLFNELHDVLSRRLNTAKDASSSALVFPGACVDGGINASGFHQTMVRACKKAGVEWKGHAWHGMRSTFATLYLEMGASQRAVQEWMSHSSIAMTDKYLGWSDEADDAEVDRLEARIRQEENRTSGPGPGNT